MAVLSVTSTHSHSSLFLSPPPPPHSSPKIYGCLSFSTILIPLPTLKPSSFSQRFSINGNWDSRRNRFRANSSDPERDFQNPPTQISQENDEISQDSSSSNPSTSLLSVLCPLLKIFSVSVSSSSPILFSSRFGGDPSKKRNYFLEVATSSLSTLARLPWGSRSLSDSSDSQEISTVDPLKRLQLFEFGEIVKYLFQQYGKGRSLSMGLLESTLLTGWVPTLLRAGRGMTLWEKARTESPSKKLELFSYENNPYARIVREALCELELPYILQTVGEGSRRTNLLLEASGSKEVPYIIDPNTGTQIGDYKKILSYLVQTYSMVSA
ncbi:hypothetical protein TEA_016549 [Camellia sinensis var. sinensis]|uniref:GST N-terminal domain-containing protein n=1 Tax=Camellia sinensis var. sinensis TaxID=542762 RepID=A0A4S4D5K8_CAMSN|nr:hypothetical protein TEA_016549 [Camellia sinensis var. sinensis]